MPEPSQPVGPLVAGWTPRPRPGRLALTGRWCRVEALDPERHAAELQAALAEGGDGLWTYLAVGPFADGAALAAWAAEASGHDDPGFVAIVDLASGRAVGLGSYLRVDPAAGSLEIGWLAFSPALQRTRAATEAIALLLRHAFDDLGYRRVEWKCDALNAPSRRAAARYGFAFEGIHRQATVVRGRNRDTAWFSILDSEWPAVRDALDAWLAPGNFDGDGRQRARLAVPVRPERAS